MSRNTNQRVFSESNQKQYNDRNKINGNSNGSNNSGQNGNHNGDNKRNYNGSGNESHKSINTGFSGPRSPTNSLGSNGSDNSLRHMGQIDVIRNLLQSDLMSDSAILRVTEKSGINTSEINFSPTFPSPFSRDSSSRVGFELLQSDASIGKVRTNHFQISMDGVPRVIYQYHISIKQLDKEGAIKMTRDKGNNGRPIVIDILSSKQKSRDYSMLINEILKRCNILNAAYDGGHTIYTTKEINTPTTNSFKAAPSISCSTETSVNSELSAISSTWLASTDIESSGSSRASSCFCFNETINIEEIGSYNIKIVKVAQINTPSADNANEWFKHPDLTLIQALDTALLSKPRLESGLSNSKWFTEGNKAFPSRNDPTYLIKLQNNLNARLGYSASLKVTSAGLTMTSDLSLSVFLACGEVVDLIQSIGGFISLDALLQSCPLEIQDKRLEQVYKHLKLCKVKLKITQYSKKFFSFGPAANQAIFDYNGETISVAEYYKRKAMQNPAYKNILTSGELKYPMLPTINVGNKTRAVLIPAELVMVMDGQSSKKKVSPSNKAKIIQAAAKLPDARMGLLCSPESALSIVASDTVCVNFGIGGNALNTVPLALNCTLLPPAKLIYRESIVDPGLSGEWKINRPLMFLKVPSNSHSNVAKEYFCVLVVKGQTPPPREYQRQIADFCCLLEREAYELGLRLAHGTTKIVDKSIRLLDDACQEFKMNGANLIIGLMHDNNCYGEIKLVCDRLGIPSQCLKWTNVEQNIKGFHASLLLKINAKMGGINHALASRSPDSDKNKSVYLNNMNLPVPESISFLFDEPTMFMGIDASRNSEPRSKGENLQFHAIVGSMDGKCGQYCAYLSVRNTKSDFSTTMQVGSTKLISTFKNRNGCLPRHIIVYRDGISENLFADVIDKEVNAIKNALTTLGSRNCEITFIVCQKRHTTRLFYEHKSDDGKSFFTNPCPGLCVDETGKTNSITGTLYTEFYINSHAPVHGTCKPCKYTMIYDENKLTLPQVEIITYWTTYLYCRCNRSVSYATPAYYAHWASKRAKTLSSAGANPREIEEISETWSNIVGIFWI